LKRKKQETVGPLKPAGFHDGLDSWIRILGSRNGSAMGETQRRRKVKPETTNMA